MANRNKIIKMLENNKAVKIDTCCACVLSLGDINRKLSSELPLEKLDAVNEKLNEIKKILNIF